MKVGDLVRHTVYKEYFGIVTFVGLNRVIFYSAKDASHCSAYNRFVEAICK